MPHTTFRVGHLTCHALEAGRQHLDGGAMFGVVPKPLWERRIPADARNRIPLALRCLLVEHDDGLVLIDTGIGNKEDDKFREDRKSTRLNSSHTVISYAVFCLKKKKNTQRRASPSNIY